MWSPLRTVLETLAHDTWDRLRDARKLGIQFGEKTITDLLLLELKRLGKGEIHVVQTPKLLENASGTDWECWIGSNRGSWLRLAIQSERLNPGS